MKLSEVINKIFSKNKKKLPSGNTVESKILPITFKNKDDKVIANYIADEIGKMGRFRFSTIFRTKTKINVSY